MSDLAETIAAYRGMTAQYYSHDFISISHADLTRLLDAAEAGVRARRTALEDAKAALKDLWFGDEVARPGSLDAMEAIDALIAASPTIEQSSKVATCNEGLQVQAEAGTVKLDLTIDAASDVGFTLSTPNVDVIRDAALEEAARVAEAVDPEKPANWLHARHKIAFAIRSLKGAA